MEVLPGVHWIRGVRGGNVFLLEEPQALTLVDAGLPGSAGRILTYLRTLGHAPQDLKTILITHGHPDHAGGAAKLRELTGAEVWAHRADTVQDSKGRPFVRFWGAPRPLASWLLPKVNVDGVLEGSETLPVLGGLRALHTPGHTPGSLCLSLERHQALFTGDMLLSNGHRLSRPLFFPGSNQRDYWQSLHHLAALEFQAALPGHGQPCLAEGSQRLQRLLALYSQAGPWWWRAVRNVPGLVKFGVSLLERHR